MASAMPEYNCVAEERVERAVARKAVAGFRAKSLNVRTSAVCALKPATRPDLGLGWYDGCKMCGSIESPNGDLSMNPRQITLCTLMSFAALVSVAAATSSQTASESFSATAAIKTASGAQATAPVTIIVTHKMSQAEADKYTSAFAKGGVAALRKALTGVAPTGSVQIGTGKATPTRLTLERPSDRGRMLTIVTDQPLMFVGAGLPDAKPKEGFDFGIIDIIVAESGAGSGTMSPAAKVTVKQGVFVVDEYSGELVRLTDVKKSK